MLAIRIVAATFAAAAVAAVTTSARADAVVVHVDLGRAVARVPDDFMGLGYETSAVAQPGYFSADNARLVNVYRNLAPTA